MPTQKIELRDAAADLDVSSNQTTGTTNICPAVTTGAVNIANGGATRTGDTTIGNALQTSGTVTARGGSVFIASNLGDCEIGAASTGADTYLGSKTIDSTTRVAAGAVTNGIVVGSNQTSGNIAIGGFTSRTGNIDIGSGSATATHLTRIRGGTLLTSTSGASTFETTGAAADVVVEAKGAGSVTKLGATTADTETQIAPFATTGDIGIGKAITTGNVHIATGPRASGSQVTIGDNTGGTTSFYRGGTTSLESGTTLAVTGGTTTTVTGATGASVVATTGTAAVTASSGPMNVTSSGDMTIAVTGNSNDLTVEAQATDGITYLGGRTANTQVRIGDFLSSSPITVGLGQTTGFISIGQKSNRSGVIAIGHASGSHATEIKGGTLTTATSGATSITSSGGDVTVDAGPAGTTYLGPSSVGNAGATTRIANSATTGVVTLAVNQTTGTFSIGSNGARSGAINIGSATSSQVNTIRGGENRLLSTGPSYLTATTGSATLEATAGDVIITGGTTVTSTSAGATSIKSTGGDVTIESGPAGTTYLGSTVNSASTTRIANGAETGGIVIGGSQTTGTINIAGDSTRTGAFNIGSGSGTQINTIRGGENRLLSTSSSYMRATTGTADLKAIAGAATVSAGTTLDLLAAGKITVESSAGDVIAEAQGAGGITKVGAVTADTATEIHNAATTADVTIGAAQTTGDILIGTGASRTTGSTIQIGDNGTITTDAVLIKGVSMLKTTGNFVPTLYGATSGVFTHAASGGTWWRWGNFITVSARLVWTANGGSGVMRVGNFPVAFPAGSGAGSYGAITTGIGRVTDLGVSGNGTIVGGAGNTYVDVQAENVNVNCSTVSAGGQFNFTVTYPVAA